MVDSDTPALPPPPPTSIPVVTVVHPPHAPRALPAPLPVPPALPPPGASQGSGARSGSGSLKWVLILGLLFFALVLATRLLARSRHDRALKERTQDASVPSVVVVHPGGTSSDTLVLPGRLRAWNQAPVYARTDGYLRKWFVDIGQEVQAGQLLAVIDTPEVDQQLRAADAALATANAESRLARSSATRWERLIGENAVSQQEVDERRGALAVRVAGANEAEANVERLRALTNFKRIVAPFAGVVTGRNTEIGALIVANAETTQALFTVADVSRLRLYVSVPQNYAGRMRDGMSAAFTLPDHPGRQFAATLDRSSQAVDPLTGAMLIQLVYDNRAGELKPGAYAQVSFTFDPAAVAKAAAAAGDAPTDPTALDAGPAVRIPVSSLLFRREGPSVALADAQGRVRLQGVTIQTDFGTELLVRGVKPSDLVIDSPPDDIRTGDRVRATLAKPEAKKDGASGAGTKPA